MGEMLLIPGRNGSGACSRIWQMNGHHHKTRTISPVAQLSILKRINITN